MTPAQLFATILTNPPIGNIDFMFTDIHISPDQFGKVVTALNSGKITVAESTKTDGADARYLPDKNRFLIPKYLESDYVHISDKALVVHEAVHAIIDINKWKATKLSGEAAGFLAQVLYRLLSGDQFRRWAKQNAGSDPMAAIYHKCLSIIDSLGLESTCGVVSVNDRSALCNLVNRHPQYKGVGVKEMHPSDGL